MAKNDCDSFNQETGKWEPIALLKYLFKIHWEHYYFVIIFENSTSYFFSFSVSLLLLVLY